MIAEPAPTPHYGDSYNSVSVREESSSSSGGVSIGAILLFLLLIGAIIGCIICCICGWCLQTSKKQRCARSFPDCDTGDDQACPNEGLPPSIKTSNVCIPVAVEMVEPPIVVAASIVETTTDTLPSPSAPPKDYKT